MKTKTKLTLLFIIAISLYSCKKETKIEYTIYKVENGWGYDVKINNKVLMHQPMIPAINKSIPFYSKEDAEKVAKLVIEKIKKKQMPPTVSKEEIQKLGIKTDS